MVSSIMPVVLVALPLCVAMGSHDAYDCNEEQSLLQARLTTPPSRISTFDGKSLLQSVQHLANSLSTSSPEAVNMAVESATASLNLILPAISDEHSHDQRAVDIQFAEIEACHNSAVHGMVATADRGQSLADRQFEKDQCDDAALSASEGQRVECDLWTRDANRLTNDLPQAAHPSTPEQFYEFVKEWREYVDYEWNTIESQRTNCIDATAASASQIQLCETTTADYVESFCEHRLACAMLNACHAHEVDVYHALIAEMEAGTVSRQAQYRTVKQVNCVLGLVTTAMQSNNTIDNDSLVSCGTDVSVEDLTLNFPDPTSPRECPARHGGDPQCAEVIAPADWANGQEAVAGAAICEGMTTCAEAYASGSTQSGTYTMCVGGQARDMYCEMAEDGQWMLVTVITTRSRTNYDKYPINGDNYEGLATNTDDWASLSETDFHDLWFSFQNPVFKLQGNDIPHANQFRAFYIQRLNDADFSPFRAMRFVPEWGTNAVDYNICEYTPQRQYSCYDEDSATITRVGPAMPDHPAHRVTIDVDGQVIDVSRNGIPMNVGCAFIYTMNGGPTNNNGWCVGDRLLITKIYIGGS